jgi:hypothetical protein
MWWRNRGKNMEAIKHLVKVPINRELKIQLPATAVADSDAEVIVLFRSQANATKEEKYALMREAVKDEMFLADLSEVMDDFQYADFERIDDER